MYYWVWALNFKGMSVCAAIAWYIWADYLPTTFEPSTLNNA